MKIEDTIDDFDFGFSFSEETANLEKQILTDEQEIQRLKETIQKLHSAIIPFLDNLCKNPKIATIHWPNRVEKIEQYKNKLQKIVEGN